MSPNGTPKEQPDVTGHATDGHARDHVGLHSRVEDKLHNMTLHSDGTQSTVGKKVLHPFPHTREKLKHTPLYNLKVKAIQQKHKLGKLGNLFNRNHRHDEKHEKIADEKRTRIAEGHRFGSFAPQREGNEIKWYVDGRDYFWAVSVALERAQDTIYIADWWLSPELFLRRPPFKNQEYRLDQILKRRAEAGVKIYVIVYREVEEALTCNSAHTKHALQALCPKGSKGHGNIKVMRHPDHNVFENAADMTFYWAHHEKFIVIDYNLAFVGGLDLCFGRWDNWQHPLSDLHPSGVTDEVWPGQDYNNNRIMDFQTVDSWEKNQLDKSNSGRMPWHDVAVGIIGPSVYDVAEHFVLRWNFCKRDKYKRDPEYDWLILEDIEEDIIGVQRPKYPVGDYVQHPVKPLREIKLEKQGTVKAQLVRSSADWSSGILVEHSIQNAYSELIRNAEHFVYIENQFFITATGEHQFPIQNTIGAAIVEACVRAGKEGRKFRVIVVIPSIPGFAGDLRDSAANGTRAIMDYQYKSICRGEHSIFERIKAQGVDPREHLFFFNLRSYDRLNKTPELQAQEEKAGVKYQQVAEAHAIEIMGHGGVTGGTDDTEGNPSSGGIKDKEKREVIEQKKRFEDAKEETHQGDQERSEDTIAKSAMLNTGNVVDETWETSGDHEKQNWINEELYIHGKCLIVDDRTVVIGSSNINDRSQLGFHDSELSIVMQDTATLPSKMDGKEYEAAHFAASLRRTLWREHLGLLEPQPLDASNDPNAQPPDNGVNNVHEGKEWEFVADPLGDELWEMWTGNATRNTTAFRDLFHCDPDDQIRNWKDYDAFLPRAEIKPGHIFDPSIPDDEVKRKLDEIKGHLVWMPFDFLIEEEMAEKGIGLNSYTESIYT